jgi:hypothetical protein
VEQQAWAGALAGTGSLLPLHCLSWTALRVLLPMVGFGFLRLVVSWMTVRHGSTLHL